MVSVSTLLSPFVLIAAANVHYLTAAPPWLVATAAARRGRGAPLLCATAESAGGAPDEAHATRRIRQATREGRLAEASKMIRAAVADGAPPESTTWSSLVAACRRAADLSTATALLDEMRRAGVRANPNQYSSLIDALVRAGQPARAAALLQHMQAACGSGDSRTHAVTIGALLRAGADSDALRITHGLLASLDAASAAGVEPPLAPDLPLFNVMLQAVLRSGAEGDSRRVLGHMREARLPPSQRTLNIMLSSFTRRGQLPAALEVFNSFVGSGGAPGAVSFNILMAAFAAHGQLLNAEGLLLQMRSQGVGPDTYTLNALLRACAATRRPYRALAHVRLLARGGAQACREDAVSVTLLANALGPAGLGLRAVREARRAARARVRLDTPCRAALLRALAQVPEDRAAAAREEALWVWEGGGEDERQRDDQCVLYMVRVLGRVGAFDEARRAFDSLPPPRSPAAWAELLALEAGGAPGLALDALKASQ